MDFICQLEFNMVGIVYKCTCVARESKVLPQADFLLFSKAIFLKSSYDGMSSTILAVNADNVMHFCSLTLGKNIFI